MGSFTILFLLIYYDFPRLIKFLKKNKKQNFSSPNSQSSFNLIGSVLGGRIPKLFLFEEVQTLLKSLMEMFDIEVKVLSSQE